MLEPAETPPAEDRPRAGPLAYADCDSASAAQHGVAAIAHGVQIQDGFLPGVPAEDRTGAPHDFSQSATLAGVPEVDLTGQGVHDPILQTTHLGILNSPQTWQSTLDFLNEEPR